MMPAPPPQSDPHVIEVGTGDHRRRIATLITPGRAPGLIWLSGFKSEMTSTKASAVAAHAKARGLTCTRFDYSGHGQSDGRFEEGTLSHWLAEAEAVFASLTQGPQVLIGSSMGGHIALLLLRRLMAKHPQEAARIAGLVLIAPAWDFTEELMWAQFPESAKRAIMEQGVWMRPSEYGEPYPITRALIEDGRHNLIGRETWDPGRPIHIIHGLLDPDVPWEHTLDLESNLAGGQVRVTAVPDGEHRLSRPRDLALLTTIIDAMVADVSDT